MSSFSRDVTRTSWPRRCHCVTLQPTAHLRFYMDEKKTKSVLEILPLVNLLAMNGDSIKFD